MLGGGGTLDKKESTKEDSILSLYIDGVEQKELPSKESGSSFDKDKSYCEEGAIIEWDSETWSPIVKNVTKTRTKCHLYFNHELWRQWVSEAKVELNAQTLNEFLEITEKVSKVFASEEATEFLIAHPELIEEIKRTPNYMDTTKITEETGIAEDARSEVVKIILDSTILSNKQKYDNKLPFYLFKEGLSDQAWTYNQWYGWCNGNPSICPSFNHSSGNSLYITVVSHPNDCAKNTYHTSNTVDLKKYNYSSVRYSGSASNNSNSPGYYFGFGNEISQNVVPMTKTILPTTFISKNGWQTAQISSLNNNYYAAIQISSCKNGSARQTTSLRMYEWYVY